VFGKISFRPNPHACFHPEYLFKLVLRYQPPDVALVAEVVQPANHGLPALPQ
jgi:hypothetical protein